jgi:hypothetical protein
MKFQGPSHHAYYRPYRGTSSTFRNAPVAKTFWQRWVIPFSVFSLLGDVSIAGCLCIMLQSRRTAFRGYARSRMHARVFLTQLQDEQDPELTRVIRDQPLSSDFVRVLALRWDHRH